MVPLLQHVGCCGLLRGRVASVCVYLLVCEDNSACGGHRSTSSVALLILLKQVSHRPEAHRFSQIGWPLSAWILQALLPWCCCAQLLHGCCRLDLGLYARTANIPQSHSSSSKVAHFIIPDTSWPSHLASMPLFPCLFIQFLDN